MLHRYTAWAPLQLYMGPASDTRGVIYYGFGFGIIIIFSLSECTRGECWRYRHIQYVYINNILCIYYVRVSVSVYNILGYIYTTAGGS